MISTVIVHFDADGNFSVLATAGVRVMTVDDRCEADRVYQHALADDREAITALIAGSQVGTADDGKSARLRRMLGQIN